MSEQLVVQITARDGASAVFAKVGNSAQTMGSSIDVAGDNASTAAGSFDTAGTSAVSMGERIDAAGAAITAVGGALVFSGQQAMEHERLVIAVTAAYGDAADEMIAFANELSSITIFSDEDILAGERFFATLRNNYGLTLEEIQVLMQTTADLASATGITFEDASSRVTAAIRGEAEAAEYLGLTMNQQAIDREGLTLTMTNQEAAQFRLNVLLDQASVYQGTAAAVADSSIGTYASLTNTLQDLAVSVGNFVGPWGSLITGFGTAAIGVSGTIGAFSRLGGALSTSRLAMAAMPLVMNPLTLGFGALAVAGTILFTKFRDGKQTISELDLSFQDLNKSVDDLKVQGLTEQAGYLQDFVTDLEEVQNRANELINDDDYLSAATSSLVRQGLSIEEAVEQVDGALLLDNKEQFESDIADITAALSDPRIDQEQLSGVLAMYRKEFELTNNLELYAERLNYTANNLSNYTAEAESATETNAALIDSFTSLAGAADAAQGAVVGIVDDLNAYNEDVADFISQGRELAGLQDALSVFNLAGLGDTTTSMAERLGTVSEALENTFRIVVSNTDAIGQTAQATEEWITALTDASEGVSQLQQIREAGVITETEYISALQAERDILAQNAIVQQEILGIQVTQAPVLATLIEQQAAYLQIVGDLPAQQQLVALGWMDSATAAQAYEATTLAAAAANNEFGASGRLMTEQMIQGAVAANPVLGQMLEQMGLISIGAEGEITVHFDSVSEGVSEIERLTMSIDALTLAMGGIPPMHVEIDGTIVEANSILGGVVSTLNGLDNTIARISVDADTEAAQAELDATAQIHAGMNGGISTIQLAANTASAVASLIAAEVQHRGMDGLSSTVFVNGDNSNAVNSIGVAAGQLAGLDGNTATVFINGVNNVGSAVGAAAAALNSIDGRTATTYINTVYSTFGSAAGAAFGSMHGGIPELAHGGVVARMGEAGAEQLHFANGGTAWAPVDALYQVPPMTYVSPANASQGQGGGVTIDFSGATFIGTNREEMNRWAEEDFIPMLRGELGMRRTGLGG